MRYRRLGRTGLEVSEIGLGTEYLEGMELEKVCEIIRTCEEQGINILDCWMPEPKVRSAIGECIHARREHWIIQGHFGATWQDGQYVRTREMTKVPEAFEDFLTRMQTDYVDLGMIHYVDSLEEWDSIVSGPFLEYVHEMRDKGVIRHVGLSSHNPQVAKKAILSGEIEMLLFSINPAFDLMPPTEEVKDYFAAENYGDSLAGMDPEREELYRLCEQQDIGITVMKGYAGGRLFKPETSPFGVALTPVQCIHYCLTRPAVASVLAGYSEPEHVLEAVAYETAGEEEKNYAAVLATAPRHAFTGKCMYCNHCKPCPINIDIGMVNKLYDLAEVAEGEVPASIREHYKALAVKASDCIACGGSEERCPFGVPVMERMELAKGLFGE